MLKKILRRLDSFAKDKNPKVTIIRQTSCEVIGHISGGELASPKQKEQQTIESIVSIRRWAKHRKNKVRI